MDLGRGEADWPVDVENKYERLEVVGKGSFGMVWMARRMMDADDEFDDEFVAIKNINIKDEKGKVYAEREISILQELRHPNCIRLIQSHPVQGNTRVVVMQLARGPNLHQLVVKRGALGLPLCRLVSRHLIAAVSYLHGRAVIHRDIKPSNCILACTEIPATEQYDWYRDDAAWSNGAPGKEAVESGRWKIMLVDFGFARALEGEEITAQTRHLRNSIIFEPNRGKEVAEAPSQDSTDDPQGTTSDHGTNTDTAGTGTNNASGTGTGTNNVSGTGTGTDTAPDTGNGNGNGNGTSTDPDPESGGGSENQPQEQQPQQQDDQQQSQKQDDQQQSQQLEGQQLTQQQQLLLLSNPQNGKSGSAIASASLPFRNINDPRDNSISHGSDDDPAVLDSLVEHAAKNLRESSFEPTNKAEADIMGAGADGTGGGRARQRHSGISMPIPVDETASGRPRNRRSKRGGGHRQSTARTNVRSMSALGTKAYAAPEIRKKLRHKTDADFEKANAAMTECVADYGMIVDAYSVGWTLRVAMTGIPPNFTLSEYMRERDVVVLEGEDGDYDEDDDVPPSCCCFAQELGPVVKIRDPARLPPDATTLIQKMTEKKPEDRMTVREAQNSPWIAGGPAERPWTPPTGDYPSQHGDPVVPLKCAQALSKLTVDYHMN